MQVIFIYFVTTLVGLVSTGILLPTRSEKDSECSQSDEAIIKKLFRLFKEIQKEYYTMQPYLISTNLEHDSYYVKKFYSPYNPDPKILKRNSDKAKELLKRLDNWEGDHAKLKPREERLFHQFRYFLRSNFDSIYENYYDGVWMLGPDYFCEQPICFSLEYFDQALQRISEKGSIKSLTDLKDLISLVRSHRHTYHQYLLNIQEGVGSGMVWSQDVCKASAKTFGKIYRRVRKHPEGILKMKFARTLLEGVRTKKGLYRGLDVNVLDQYKADHGEEFEKTLNDTIIKHIGEPILQLYKYLKLDHIKACPDSSISSGLGKLPLQYKYDNNKIIGKTSQSLPDDGPKIDVKEGYQNFLMYYTSGNFTAEEAYQLGERLVHSYYEQVKDLAVEITGKDDKEEAVEELKKKLKSDEFYMNNEGSIPENESDDEAHDLCDDEEDAQKNCPKRWECYEKWKQRNEKIMNEAKPYIKHLFYEEGENKTTPNCQVKIVPDFDPTNGVPSYLESDPLCEEPAEYYLPFFKARMGPTFDDYNTNFHEANPGHHLQIQGYLENFMDECEDISMWLNNLVDYYPAFSEGWGLYAENPILLKDVDILKSNKKDEKFSRYGALKWQIWRALRLIADVGFHQKKRTRKDMKELFEKFTWDTSDTVKKELTRYQGTPGQATSYTLGQQTILHFRNHVKKELGDEFDIKDFHYVLLSVGQAPFDYIKLHIENYIKCKKNTNVGFQFCDFILGTRKNSRKRGAVIMSDPIKDKRQSFINRIIKTTRRKKHL